MRSNLARGAYMPVSNLDCLTDKCASFCVSSSSSSCALPSFSLSLSRYAARATVELYTERCRNKHLFSSGLIGKKQQRISSITLAKQREKKKKKQKGHGTYSSFPIHATYPFYLTEQNLLLKSNDASLGGPRSILDQGRHQWPARALD